MLFRAGLTTVKPRQMVFRTLNNLYSLSTNYDSITMPILAFLLSRFVLNVKESVDRF